MATTVVASAGQSPDFLQLGPGAANLYGAIDLRRLGGAGGQEGVVGGTGGAYKVALSAGMVLTVAASTVEGALVQGDTISAQGLYFVPPHSAAITETVTAAHATLPRLDKVVLEVLDANHDGGGSNLARVRIIAGTATAGTTLDNGNDGAHGAPALPASTLLLADVLVPAAAGSILAANIRDRRKWGMGAYIRTIRSSNAAAGNDYTVSATSLTDIDATNLSIRVEGSGVPMRVSLRGAVAATAGGLYAFFGFTDNAAYTDGMTSTFPPYGTQAGATAGAPVPLAMSWDWLPAAGSHLIRPQAYVNSSNIAILARATAPLLLVIEEVARPNASNT